MIRKKAFVKEIVNSSDANTQNQCNITTGVQTGFVFFTKNNYYKFLHIIFHHFFLRHFLLSIAPLAVVARYLNIFSLFHRFFFSLRSSSDPSHTLKYSEIGLCWMFWERDLSRFFLRYDLSKSDAFLDSDTSISDSNS